MVSRLWSTSNSCRKSLKTLLNLAKKTDQQLILPAESIAKCVTRTLQSVTSQSNIVNPIGDELLTKLKQCAPLSQSITPEMETEILADAPNRTFVLRQVVEEIHGLENRRKSLFTLPKSLNIEQWKTLMSLTDFRSRLTYLQAVDNEYGASMQQIEQLEKKFSSPLQISEETIASCSGNNQEARKSIELFLMYHEMQRQEGQMVPYSVDNEELTQIGGLTTSNSIRSFIKYLLKTEMAIFYENLRKLETNARNPKMKEEALSKLLENKHIIYGLGYNCINLRLQRETMNYFYNHNVVREFNDWGIPLVIDMSYYDGYKMDAHRRSSLSKELLNAISFNKSSKAPFQLHLTNVSNNCQNNIINRLGLSSDFAPCNITSECHLQMFPRDRLVYLSPDSRNDLKYFNHQDIYVIGGILDKFDDRQPFTLSAAKKLKIRHARLPMKQYIGLTAELNIETCVNILADVKDSQDWFFAMRWVPSRHFANRVRSGNNLEHQLIYRAHRHLSPTVWKGVDEMVRNQRLGPAKYRSYYSRIMKSQTREEMEEILQELKI